MAGIGSPEPLDARHVLDGFDCGQPSLDAWLQKHAREARGVGSARTFVAVDAEQERVVGYHALVVAEVAHQVANERVAKGMPRHPIPAVLLARLAADRSVQGRGLGTRLLLDSMVRTIAAAETVGIRALVVHALHDDARRLYLRRGFRPSRTDERHLMMLVKDARAALAAAARGCEDARA